MEKQIKKIWIAGFFLPAINATVFSPNLHVLHCSNKNSSGQDLYIITLVNTQSKPHLEIQIINCKKKVKIKAESLNSHTGNFNDNFVWC